jgi:hypothetical protein
VAALLARAQAQSRSARRAWGRGRPRPRRRWWRQGAGRGAGGAPAEAAGCGAHARAGRPQLSWRPQHNLPAPASSLKTERVLPGILMQLLEDDDEGVTVAAASALAALSDHSGSVRDRVGSAHFGSTPEKVSLNPVQDDAGEMEGVFG